MSDGFHKTVEKILITIMIGGGVAVGVRSGNDPMREEFMKFRQMATQLLENHEQRLSNIERLSGLGR